jgi:chemotaxis protein CheZ
MRCGCGGGHENDARLRPVNLIVVQSGFPQRERAVIVTEPDSSPDHPMRASMRAELAPQFDELRRFVDRRIAELSAEVHATVQMVDFSEANLSGQLARIHEQIATVVALPSAATRNSGLELEAVVQATEAAANRIMEAAEAIGDWLREGGRDPAAMEAIAEKVNTIFEACTFQDITGQRIRRAIEHLQHVESMLTEIMPEEARPTGDALPSVSPDLHQDAVDQLFTAAPVAGKEMGQDDVDQLFA